MRNPFRLKNLDSRFAPAALAGLALLAWSEPGPRSIASGAPLVAAGLFVRAWAVGHLVKTERLTLSGPYAHLRHPLYLGTLLIGLGIALMLGGIAAALGAGVVGTWFVLLYMPRKERTEAARLLGRHGDAYARYRAAVPSLWPRLRAWESEEGASAGVGEEPSWRLERFDANNELGTVIAVLLAVTGVCLRAGIG